jgi:hypothetical protein
MKKSITLLALMLPLSCLAVNPEINEKISYSGKIGEQNIFMTLSTSNSKVLGSYFYVKYKTPITLSGSFSDSKLLLIEKTVHGDAHINAEIKEDTIDGIWELNGKHHKIHSKSLSKSYKSMIREINILNEDNENQTLSISFRNGTSQKIDISILEPSTLILFEDFTFDGYPDMRILELEAGGNSSFIYFDYDVKTGNFVTSSNEISRLVNPEIFHSEKIIISTSRDGCCTYRATKILSKEVHSANYDFESKTGNETIKNKETGNESRKSINAKYFEDNYLNFKEGLN